MRLILSFLIASLIGTTIIVNGVTLNAQDVLSETKKSVSGVNLHQIKTALELYYFDHNIYPPADSGEALFCLLREQGYIEGMAFDETIFNYDRGLDGQDYHLSVSK